MAGVCLRLRERKVFVSVSDQCVCVPGVCVGGRARWHVLGTQQGQVPSTRQGTPVLPDGSGYYLGRYVRYCITYNPVVLVSAGCWYCRRAWGAGMRYGVLYRLSTGYVLVPRVVSSLL